MKETQGPEGTEIDIYIKDLKPEVAQALAEEYGYSSITDWEEETNGDVFPITSIIMHEKEKG